jgi:hypothetical protein
VAIYLVGVDIGSSGAMAMVLDLAGNPLVSANQEYSCTSPGREGSSRTRTTRWRPPLKLLPGSASFQLIIANGALHQPLIS